MMVQDHREDYLKVLGLIQSVDSFALSRFADGEASILKNINVGNRDGWKYQQDKNLVFRSYLRSSLSCNDPNFIYGISSRNVDEQNYLFLLKFIQQDIKYLTFSDIWVNNNYDHFRANFHKSLCSSGKRVILLTGSRAKPNRLLDLFDIYDYELFPGNCVKHFETNKDYFFAKLDLLSSLNDNCIFLIALGPLSNIAIQFLWGINPNNVYLDIGSTYDPILFGRKSRNYHKEDHPDRKVIDLW
jgi:hypothetical protein